jgi:hypothetical protein
MSDLRDEIAKNLPIDLIPDFVGQYNNRAVGYTTKAQENNMQVIREKNAVSYLQARNTLTKSLQDNAYNGNFDAVKADFESYVRTTEGQVGLADGITAESAVKDIENMWRNITIQQGLGSIARAPDYEKAAVVAALSAEGSDFRNQFTPEEWPSVLAEMTTSMSAAGRAKEAAEQDYVTGEKNLAASRAKEIILLSGKPETMADAMDALKRLEEEAVTNPHIDERDILAARKAVYDPPSFGNEVVANAIKNTVTLGEGEKSDEMLKQAMRAGQLTPQQVTEISELRASQASGYYDELIKNPEMKRIVAELDRLYADAGFTPGSYKWTPDGQKIYEQILEFGTEKLSAYKQDPTKGPPKLWAEYGRIRATKEQKKEEAAKGNFKVKVGAGARAKDINVPPQYASNPQQYLQDLKDKKITGDLAREEVQIEMAKRQAQFEREAREKKPATAVTAPQPPLQPLPIEELYQQQEPKQPAVPLQPSPAVERLKENR